MRDNEGKSNQNEDPIDMSKVSPAFKAYIEERNALFAKYGKQLPSLREAA